MLQSEPISCSVCCSVHSEPMPAKWAWGMRTLAEEDLFQIMDYKLRHMDFGHLLAKYHQPKPYCLTIHF